MKKIFLTILSTTMVLTMAACGSGSPASSDNTTQNGTTGSGAEIALISDLGGIDDKSFNQGSWEGVIKYAEENNISYTYYKPTEQSDDAYLASIDLAVKGGAKVVVAPGYLFETPVYMAQDRYPEVSFILVDGTPHDANGNSKIGDKTVAISYAEEQSGFLAGYAAVKDGNTKLGFMGGMAVPAVVRYGYGYVQGAEYAAEELGLEAGSVTLNYHYTGSFAASPEGQSTAASWYNSGIEVIFSCGGPLGNAVMAAAEQAGTKVIGVDVDQSAESDAVFTSATKDLTSSVYQCLTAYYDGSFPGGESIVFTAQNNGVALPMVNSHFETFSQQDYDAIYDVLKSGSINIMNDVEKSVTDIPLKIIALTEI